MMSPTDIEIAEPRPNRALTLKDALSMLRPRWPLFSAIIAVAVCVFLFGGLVTSTVYRSSATLAISSTDPSRTLLDATGSLAGLASLAGVNLSAGSDRTAIAAILQSRALAAAVIRSENLLPMLFPERWDTAGERWKATKQAPEPEEAFRRWNRRIFRFDEDNLTRLVTISIDAPTPELAQRWADSYLAQADHELRSQAIEEAEQNIAFLNARLNEAPQVEIRATIGRLLEREINQLMIAQGKAMYAFRVVDKPFKPDRPYKPNFPLLAALGFVFGVFSCAAVGALLIARASPP